MGGILVTGASGTVGRAVAAALVSAGESVVSAVRNPAGSEFARNPAGSEFGRNPPAGTPRAFDFADPTGWAGAFAGVDRLFLLRPPAIASIREQGEIYLPAARARTAFVDARDIGRVAARVFTEPGHLRKAYALSGEQSLDYYQVADILSEVLGRGITYARPSSDDYLARLAGEGAPADVIAVQKMIYRVVRLGVSAFPNRAIRRLSGEPATTFRQFATDHRDVWL